MVNGKTLFFGLVICLSVMIASGTAFAANYDSVSVSTTYMSSITYQNLGTTTAGVGTGYITNLTEPAQELVITSQIPNAFSYVGKSSSTVTYLLTTYALNERGHSDPAGEPVNISIFSPCSTSFCSSIITPSNPLVITITGYPSSISTSPVSATVTLTAYSSVSQKTSLGFYNITSIRLSRAVPVYIVSVTNSTGQLLANLLLAGPQLIFPQSGVFYYGISDSTLVYYNQQNGQPTTSFNFAQPLTTTGSLSSAGVPVPILSAYEMPERVAGNTSTTDVFGFDLDYVLGDQYYLNNSMLGNIPNSLGYLSGNGVFSNVGVGFTSQKGSVVTLISPTSLTFNLALTAPSPTVLPITISTSPSSVNVSVGQTFSITNNTSGGVKPYTFSYSYTCEGSSPCTQQYLARVRNGNSFTFTQMGTYIINLCAAGSGSSTSICANTWVNVGSSITPSEVSVTASDPQDYYVRDWQVFVNEYPGPYLGNGQYTNSSTYSQVFGSSGTMSFAVPSGGSGVEYLDIGQSGGSSYGTYSGTVTINGYSQSFGGLDVNHVLKIMFSRSSITGISVVALPSIQSTSCSNLVSNGDFETGNFDSWFKNSQTITLSRTAPYVYAGSYSANVTNGELQQQGIQLSQCGGYPSTLSFAVYLESNTVPDIAVIAYPYSSGSGDTITYMVYNPAQYSCSTFAGTPTICIPESRPNQWYYITRNLGTDLASFGYPQGSYISAYIGLGTLGTSNLNNIAYYDNVVLGATTGPSIATTITTVSTIITSVPTTIPAWNTPSVHVQATDPNDPYLRDWDLFYNFPGAYLGNGNFQNRSVYTAYGYSGYNFYYNNLPASGTFYIVIGQSGGSAYGTYQGTIWLGTQSTVFSGLDANHALKVTYDTSSVPNIKSISVVPLPVSSTTSTTSTTTTVVSTSICTGGYFNTTTQTCQIRHSCPVGYTLTPGGACIPPTNQTESYTVDLRSGWNLISPALNTFNYQSGINNNVSTTCSGLQTWAYDINGDYSRAKWYDQYFGTGYWAYTSSACRLTYYGEPLPSSAAWTLSKGWNLIGFPLNVSPVSFSSITGSCNVVAGPYWYDPDQNRYVDSSMILPGRGYFVYVSGACSLQEPSGTPPEPPSTSK